MSASQRGRHSPPVLCPMDPIDKARSRRSQSFVFPKKVTRKNIILSVCFHDARERDGFRSFTYVVPPASPRQRR